MHINNGMIHYLLICQNHLHISFVITLSSDQINTTYTTRIAWIIGR